MTDIIVYILSNECHTDLLLFNSRGCDMKFIKCVFKLAAVAILIAVGVVFYAFRVEPYLLTVKEYTVAEAPIEEEITLVQLSDLEMSKDYTEDQLPEILDKVKALEPDIIVFTGDLFSNYGKYRPVESVVSALSEMQAKYGKYAVWGNNDYGGGAVRVYEDLMRQSGFQLLNNSGVNVTLDSGEIIFLGGLDDSHFGYQNLDLALEDKEERAAYSILLSHEPDIADDIPADSVDMMLSGHTHGGQVKIKYFRNKVGIEGKYMSGAYELEHLEDTTLYVNNGLGTSRMPVRFLVPPQISCFKIGGR